MLRILPREEWPRLVGTELEAVWPHLPESAQVIVVEDGDRIVGCWAVFSLVHVEGLWIAPDKQKNPRIGIQLLRGMEAIAGAMGAKAVNTGAMSDDVVRLLEKRGAVELPGRHFSMTIKRGEIHESCQQP